MENILFDIWKIMGSGFKFWEKDTWICLRWFVIFYHGIRIHIPLNDRFLGWIVLFFATTFKANHSSNHGWVANGGPKVTRYFSRPPYLHIVVKKNSETHFIFRPFIGAPCHSIYNYTSRGSPCISGKSRLVKYQIIYFGQNIRIPYETSRSLPIVIFTALQGKPSNATCQRLGRISGSRTRGSTAPWLAFVPSLRTANEEMFFPSCTWDTWDITPMYSPEN